MRRKEAGKNEMETRRRKEGIKEGEEKKGE